MKLPSRHKTPTLPGVSGTARCDRRTSALVRRLHHGDVAVVDQMDLDRGTAQELLDSGVVAVVSASALISGRYPNLGPELLTTAGVAVVDNVGPEVFTAVRDGARVRVHDGEIFEGDTQVAHGRHLDNGTVAALMQQARQGLTTQLQSFAYNTSEFVKREQNLLLHGEGAPITRTPLEGRHVVVVTGGDHAAQLKRMRRYLKEQRPVLVGVDSGADVLLASGHRPDLVVVGPDGLAHGSQAGQRGSSTISDPALRGGAEVVVRTDSEGRVPGGDRLDRLGVRFSRFASSSSSRDVALLLSDLSGAALTVLVGDQASLHDFLDHDRTDLASSFLTRLRLGGRLVDATAVPHLYAGRVRLWQMLLVLLAGIATVLVAIAITPVGQSWLADGQELFNSLTEQILGTSP